MAILDADQQGFLRSKSSLIQIYGSGFPPCRWSGYHSMLILFLTPWMVPLKKLTVSSSQFSYKYILCNHITPKSVVKSIRPQIIEDIKKESKTNWSKIDTSSLTPVQRKKQISQLKKQMRAYAADLDFESAISIRDQIRKI